MTITLPPHRVWRLEEIVSSIPRSQRRIGVDKWHWVLGYLRSIVLVLPGARGIFSQIQEAVCPVKGKRVMLSTGVHEALVDFRWLAEDVDNRPTRIYELVLIRPAVYGYHNTSCYMCVTNPSAARPSPNLNGAHPIVWRMPLPKDIVDSLVSCTNPQRKVNNSELELAGGVVHSDCVAHFFVVTECTVFSRTNNTAGLWWQRKSSATCTSSPVHLLRLQAMHQWFHCYVPRIDFVSGVDNLISDRPSCSSDLTDNQLLAYLDTNFP